MKIAGRVIQGKNKKTIVFPREGQESIVIKAEAVSDPGRVHELLSLPKPPVKVIKGGEKVKNFDDPGYQEQVINYEARHTAWVVLTSLTPSEIEWETVNMNDPTTWTNYEDELKKAGFSFNEINLIHRAVSEANSLDEDKLEAARLVFLRGEEDRENGSSGPQTPVPNS
jgi:hypothetical protein